MADGRLRPVAGVDVHLVAQREQDVEDRAHDPRIVASRQVGAPDRLAEERVTEGISPTGTPKMLPLVEALSSRKASLSDMANGMP